MPKKARVRARPKSRKRPYRLLLIVILILGPILIWYVNYGITNEPLVEFNFGSAGQIRQNYRLSATSKFFPGTIDIFNVFVRNRGKTEINLIITVHAINALVSTSYSGPYNEIASRSLVVPNGSDYRPVTFYLTLKTQATFFSLACQAGKVLDLTTLQGSIATIFGDIQPGTPTYLRYSQAFPNSYDYQIA